MASCGQGRNKDDRENEQRIHYRQSCMRCPTRFTNLLVNHGFDRTCANCAEVGLSEFCMLTPIDVIDKHKTPVNCD